MRQSLLLALLLALHAGTLSSLPTEAAAAGLDMRPMNTEGDDGEPPDGELPDGDLPDRDLSDDNVPGGDLPEDDLPDLELPDRDLPGGHDL